MKFIILATFVLFSFSRADYGTWIDADNDCQNTRDEVLIAESLEPVVLNKKGCKVISGKWYDYYTAAYFYKATDLDIDHLVPLAEVERSGGNKWPNEKRKLYANDIGSDETLIVVSKGANRSKSDKDPAKWMPKNEAYRCDYLRRWREVKAKWQLSEDSLERNYINNALKTVCANKR